MSEDSDRRKPVLRDRPDNFSGVVRPGDAVYQGSRPSVVDEVPAILKPGREGFAARKGLRARGLSLAEVRFCRALASGANTALDAYIRAFPERMAGKTESGLRSSAWAMHKRVIKKLGGEESDELYDMLGIGFTAQARVAREAMDAKSIKVFIVPKTGEVVESQEYVDHQTRLAAAGFASKITGTSREKVSGVGAIQVNIIQYSRPGDPPWPGGGRQ